MTAEWTASLPRKRMGAGVLFRRAGDDDRVLLVEPTYKPGREIPDGVLDAAVVITLRAEELRSWIWATPREVEELMLPFVARRVTAARHAAVAGTTVYLELGFEG